MKIGAAVLGSDASQPQCGCTANVRPPLLQEIIEFRVLSHECADEGALGDDLQALRAHDVQRAARERGTDAAA